MLYSFIIVQENHTKYIAGLDALRAFSVMLVLANHIGSYEILPDTDFWKLNFWQLISGETGVNVFFVISGFLITYLLLKEYQATGTIAIRYFIIRRFLRLMPPLIIMLFVYLILVGFNQLSFNIFAFFASLFYVYNYLPQRFNITELTHTWSLGVEEQFYLIWPFVLRFFKRKYIIISLLFIQVFAVVWLYFLPGISLHWQGKEVFLAESFRPYRWLFPACVPVIWGVLAAFLWQDHRAFLTKIPVVFFPLIAFLTFLFPLFSGSGSLFLSVVIQSFGISYLILYFMLNQSTGKISWLEWKPLAFIGKISYGLYIYQGIFLRTGPGSGIWFQQFPQQLVLTIVVALISYFTIEAYFRKLRSQFRKV